MVHNSYHGTSCSYWKLDGFFRANMVLSIGRWVGSIDLAVLT